MRLVVLRGAHWRSGWLRKPTGQWYGLWRNEKKTTYTATGSAAGLILPGCCLSHQNVPKIFFGQQKKFCDRAHWPLSWPTCPTYPILHKSAACILPRKMARRWGNMYRWAYCAHRALAAPPGWKHAGSLMHAIRPGKTSGGWNGCARGHLRAKAGSFINRMARPLPSRLREPR